MYIEEGKWVMFWIFCFRNRFIDDNAVQIHTLYNWEVVMHLLSILSINCPIFERPNVCVVFKKLNFYTWTYVSILKLLI